MNESHFSVGGGAEEEEEEDISVVPESRPLRFGAAFDFFAVTPKIEK